MIANDLSVPVDAAVAFDLAAPDLSPNDDLAPSSPCATVDSVAYLDGEPGNSVYMGQLTLHPSSWQVGGGLEQDTFYYSTTVDQKTYAFGFSSKELGAPLTVRRYDNAKDFGTPGAPGLEISAVSTGCNAVTGWFEIESIAGGPRNDSITELTATFEQRCIFDTAVLRGCIHFKK